MGRNVNGVLINGLSAEERRALDAKAVSAGYRTRNAYLVEMVRADLGLRGRRGRIAKKVASWISPGDPRWDKAAGKRGAGQ